MISRVILGFLGFCHILVSIWCAVDSAGASNWLGHSLELPAAQSEFFVIYVGLHLALGIIFIAAAVKEKMTYPGLVGAVILHTTMLAVRIITVLSIDEIGTGPKIMFSLEALTAVLAVLAVSVYHPPRWVRN